MEKKTALITGATRGIGKETALGLAKLGHHIIIHGRDEAKLLEVANEIKTVSKNKNVETIVADLSSLSDTKRMTDEFKSRYTQLDILINDAGIFPNKVRETTSDGHEKTLTINLFAPFLIIQTMKPALLKSTAPRIINVSSAMHRRAGRPDFSDLQFERNYSPIRVYGLSKLYLIWVTRHLSMLLKKHGAKNVTVNALHPGAIATNFGQDAEMGFFVSQMFKLAQKLMDKPADGARTSIYLATSPKVENVSGKYFNKRGKIEQPDDRYWSPGNEEFIWNFCTEITGKYL